MQNIIRKITSRKFLVAAAGVIMGIVMALGENASDVQTIAGAVVAVFNAVTYIVTEGKVDAASVQNTVLAIEDALEVIEDE